MVGTMRDRRSFLKAIHLASPSLLTPPAGLANKRPVLSPGSAALISQRWFCEFSSSPSFRGAETDTGASRSKRLSDQKRVARRLLHRGQWGQWVPGLRCAAFRSKTKPTMAITASHRTPNALPSTSSGVRICPITLSRKMDFPVKEGRSTGRSIIRSTLRTSSAL